MLRVDKLGELIRAQLAEHTRDRRPAPSAQIRELRTADRQGEHGQTAARDRSSEDERPARPWSKDDDSARAGGSSHRARASREPGRERHRGRAASPRLEGGAPAHSGAD
jgi:hypothetical protein